MSKLINISSKSPLMNIQVKLDGEVIEFNLYRELRIDENFVQDELKNHTRQYAFLAMLHKKLIKQVSDLELALENLEGNLYGKYKALPGTGTRARSKDLAKADLKSDTSYMIAMKKLNSAIHDKNIIEVCVKAFETRASLLQTLSANIRKEV